MCHERWRVCRRIGGGWWEGGKAFDRSDWMRGGAGVIKKKKEWECRQPGSNQRPSDLQSDALPTELYRRGMGLGEVGTGRGMTTTKRLWQKGAMRELNPRPLLP